MNEELILRLIDIAFEKGPDAWKAAREMFGDKHRSIEETIKKLEALPPAYQRKHAEDMDDGMDG